MPSPTAGLFGGLATGIFGRMREHEDEQRKMDLEERSGALKSLGSLLEHATPETRPTIYKQMADVMKLKGKHRGVWDMLTGQGRDDYHNQLSSQLDGVFGNVVGPEKYQQLQQQGVQQDLGAAFQANDPSVRSSQPLPQDGKIALRDPIAEHLNSLRTQYGMQNDRRSQEIELRNKLTGERELANDQRDFDFKTRDRDHAAQIAAEKKVRAAATALALKRQSKVPSDEEYAAAAEQVAAADGLNVDKLKAQIGLIGAETKRNEAQATYYGSGGAGGAEKPITPFQQQGIDEKQQEKGIGTYNKFSAALGEINKIGARQTALRTQLSSINPLTGAPDPTQSFKFDEQSGTFSGPNGPVKFVNPAVQKMVQELTTAEANKIKFKKELDTHRSVLETYHGNQFNVADEWTVAPNKDYGAVAPAGAQRTGNPPEWKVPVQPKPTAGLQGQGEFHDRAGAKPRKVGEIIDTGKGKIRIVGIKGKGLTGGIEYIVEGVQ